MNQETIYCIDLFHGRNAGNSFSYFDSTTITFQEDVPTLGEVTGHNFKEKPDLTIHNSNTRLDKYLFYFSSKL